MKMKKEQRRAVLDRNRVARLVGIYDLVIGLWPLVGKRTFTAVAKKDPNAKPVRTIGYIWAGLGAALLLCSGDRKMVNRLAMASILGGSTLAAAETALVATGKIPKRFLLQALSETVVGALWIMSFLTDRRKRA